MEEGVQILEDWAVQNPDLNIYFLIISPKQDGNATSTQEMRVKRVKARVNTGHKGVRKEIKMNGI